MRKILFVLLCFLPLGQSLSVDRYVTFGVGNDSCGKFVKEQNLPILDSAYLNPAYFGIWLTGYITRYARDNKVESISTDINGMELWILNYCKENPTRNLAYASAMLLRHLEELNQIKYSK